MRILLLRGKVPSDRDPKEILFDNIEDCDDIYLSLVHSMTGNGEHSEVWYWDPPKGFPKKWEDEKITVYYGIPRTFQNYDLIWARGGFE